MADHAAGLDQGLVLHGNIEFLGAQIGPQRTANLHRAQRPARSGAATKIFNQFFCADTKCRLHNATPSNIARQLKYLGPERAVLPQRRVGLGSAGQNRGHAGNSQHVIDHGGGTEQAFDRR